MSYFFFLSPSNLTKVRWLHTAYFSFLVNVVLLRGRTDKIRFCPWSEGLKKIFLSDSALWLNAKLVRLTSTWHNCNVLLCSESKSVSSFCFVFLTIPISRLIAAGIQSERWYSPQPEKVRWVQKFSCHVTMLQK